jgi:dCTP deaminase
MILTDSAITQAVAAGVIVITPFDVANLGSNSYDVHLSPHFAVYALMAEVFQKGQTTICRPTEIPIASLDADFDHKVTHFDIASKGLVLQPGILYLASTLEYTETHKHVPYIDGKSSVGRLGISIHPSCGRGDIGFCGHWTLEISVIHPVRVYPGMPIGQLTYHLAHGECERPYRTKPGASYNNADPRPMPSALWKKLNPSATT